MSIHTVTVDKATFEVSNVIARKTNSYGHYTIHADIDGKSYTSRMDASYLYDDMYRETDTQEDTERQKDAEIAVARIIIRANQLV
jgi:hypothetical protein